MLHIHAVFTLSAFIGTCGRQSSRNSPLRASELNWRRQQQEKSKIVASTNAPTGQNDRIGAASPNLATGVDKIEFFGMVGGSKLTREGIRESQRAASPIVRFEERLQEGICEAGNLPPAEGCILMEDLINEARASGVPTNTPAMKAASTFVHALEVAASQAKDEDKKPPVDPLSDQMNALFADDYPMPDMLPDLE